MGLPPPPPSRLTSLATIGAPALALALGLGGCRACDDHKPYVPPVVEAAAPKEAEEDAGAEPSVEPERPSGLVEPALAAPPGVTSWTTSGMTLEAGGREIVLALVRDFDGDGRSDALAIIRSPEQRPGAPTGELVYFSGAGGPPGAIALGPELGIEPSCVPTARLEKIGPRSAFAEIGSACPTGTGSRAAIVVRLPQAGTPAPPAVAFDAVVVDPREAPKLTIDADAADRDGDGIADVTLRIAIEGGGVGYEGAPRLGAKLAFYDRPAGASRDRDEPDASLRAIASQATARAAKAKDAPEVPALVQQMRALYRAMCLEGGAPRITKVHGGSPISCGTSRPLEDAGVAEVRAYVTQGDALRAFAAAEIAQLAPATKTAAKTKELEKFLGEVAPGAAPASVRALGVLADPARDRHPEWGPLAFDANGDLLVRRGSSVVRVDAEIGDEIPTDIEPWSSEVLSPDGATRWLEAYHACEGVALRATLTTGGGDLSDVMLPIPPRLGRRCSGGRGEPAQTTAIAWSARGLEALVAGQPVLIKASPPEASPLGAFLGGAAMPGSPRSPGGQMFVVATPRGLLVRGRPAPGKWSLVRSSELEPTSELRHCTITDDAKRIACLRRGRVVLVTFP